MKVIINGYKGKMGQLIDQGLKDSEEIVGKFDQDNQLKISDLIDLKPDVVIDFTVHNEAKRVIRCCLNLHIPLVVGTTGFKKEEIIEFDSLAKQMKTPIYLVSNYSLSFKYLLEALKLLAPQYQKLLIEEEHHISKADCPSGTALRIKEALQNDKTEIISKRSNEYVFRHDIIFSNESESLRISHQVFDKKNYLSGIKYALKHLDFIGLRETI